MPVTGLCLTCTRPPIPCSCFSYRSRLPSLRLVVNAATTRRREAASVRPEGPRLSILSTLGFAVRNRPEQELARQTVEQAAQNDLKEELELAQKAAQPPPDLRPFLHPVGAMEARYVRMLSALCTHTYFLPKITAINLHRRHRLKLVTTSLACDISLREARHSADEVAADSDAMAADPRVVELLARSSPQAPQEWQRQLQEPRAPIAVLASSQGGRIGNSGSGAQRPPSPQRTQIVQAASAEGSAVAAAAAEAAELVTLEGEAAAAAPGTSPTDVVANSLAVAAGAAAAAAASVYSAAASAAAAIPATAASAAAPLANNIVAFSRVATWSSLPPVRLLAEQLQMAAMAGHSTAAATVAAVSAALESARTKDRPKGCQSPTEWFVCDDEATHTRYFVLQGSDNLDHWRVNLTFDPVTFEDAALGVKVHRGFYECAQALYDRFLPMVQDHLATSPFARFAFTGHSLGGSLATLLMFMFVRRGVLPASCLAPTYTFGSPAILCEGAGGSCSCGSNGAGDSAGGGSCAVGGDAEAMAGCGASSSASVGVLARLGLPQGAVRNVMMHKDIVPRAFACDYSLLASLLRRVSGSFRDHSCLQGERQAMFHAVGQVLVLQPDEHLAFVGGEGYHPMLPPGPGLYLLRQPTLLQTMKSDVARMGRALQECADAITAGAPDASPASLEPGSAQHSSDDSCVIGSKAKPGLGPVPETAADALFALYNNPHPLDMLGNSAAYGTNGQISRYHNPDNYCKALGAVLRARGATWQRLVSHASRTGLRWHAAMLEPAPGASQMLAIRGRLGMAGGKLSAVRAKPAAPMEGDQVAAGLETC